MFQASLPNSNPTGDGSIRLLRQAYAEAKEAGDSQKQLHAALALLPVDDTQLPYLKDRLLRADAQDISVIRQSLAGHKDALVAECWRVLEKPTQEDQGKHSRRQARLASTILRILSGRSPYRRGESARCRECLRGRPMDRCPSPRGQATE